MRRTAFACMALAAMATSAYAVTPVPMGGGVGPVSAMAPAVLAVIAVGTFMEDQRLGQKRCRTVGKGYQLVMTSNGAKGICTGAPKPVDPTWPPPGARFLFE